MEELVVLEKLIEKYFGDKVDKGGNPYVIHCRSVGYGAQFVASTMLLLSDEEVKICREVGYLHDILEDTDCPEEELISLGISPKSIEIIKLLTHQKNEPYDEYLDKILQNGLACIVKYADMSHNMQFERLGDKVDEDTKARLKKKYEPRIKKVQSALFSHFHHRLPQDLQLKKY